MHLSRRLKCTTVITRCPPSVRPSSVVVNLSHFRLLIWNCQTEFNETWQEARTQHSLPILCFSGWSEKQDDSSGLWLAVTFSTPPLKLLNRIQRNLTRSKISMFSTKFVFFGPIEKTRWPPGFWFAETFSTSPLKPLKGIQRNLTGSKISTSSTKFVFFGTIGKTTWPPKPLIGWDIFDFFSKTAAFVFAFVLMLRPFFPELVMSTDLLSFEHPSVLLFCFRLLLWNRLKQDLNVLYHVYVFRADRKNKMAALASDWLRHFRLLLWNRWTEFNDTWQ